ncbi:MAG: copper chaperone PCu(A)C [Rhodocyclaceae bacterium]|nr:copper chaperone PCu(A)C [Rhodocyclaceae bacterium]MBP6280039.1 copper chaperone PCu(A)C [Rhodocyclaceae bacterium]
MKPILRNFLTIISLQMATISIASSAEILTVSNPWVRATVPAQQVTGAFMTLTAAADLRLVAVSSPQAGMVEIHQMAMENNVMQMRALPDGLALPKGKAIELKPGGYHLMVMDLKRPMQQGAWLPLTLTVETKDKKRSTVVVSAEVKALTTK